MPKQKKIAYKKCHQCRKDRQKCLPEDRIWPGTKCERCQHYGYLCSAMKTKHEESLATSGPGTSTEKSPGLPSITASASPPSLSLPSTSSHSTSPEARRSETRCLQDLGDLRQLSTLFRNPLLNRYIRFHPLGWVRKALDAVVQETMEWARQHEADGRYRDAEYLFRRASFNKKLPMESAGPYQRDDVLPTLVSVYEKMGDYPAAEMAQEALLRRLFSKDVEQVFDEQVRAIQVYSRLLSCFKKRILKLAPKHSSFSRHVDSFITYRAAVLDVLPLNEVLVEQGLIVLNPAYCCTSFLHIAAKENAINLARLLIEKGAYVNDGIWDFHTPLHIATGYAEPAMIKLRLANGAKIQAKDDDSGASPLHIALTRNRDKQVLALLIHAKADLEAKDKLGRTALAIAIRKDLPVSGRFLLQHGANANAFINSSKETLLLTAVRNGIEWATKLLLENGASLIERDAQGYTALCVAVARGQEPIIQTLLDHGATTKTTVDEQNPDNDILLHCAVMATNVAIVEMLLKAGADTNGRDSYGNTALHQAVKEGQKSHERMVRLLLTHSASLDAVNIYGQTVLHCAVLFRRANMVVVIADHIEPDQLPIMCQIKNKSDQTPLDMARSLAENAEESNDESLVLWTLENHLELSHTYMENIT